MFLVISNRLILCREDHSESRHSTVSNSLQDETYTPGMYPKYVDVRSSSAAVMTASAKEWI